ncbi:MAG: hypothetical protein WD512_12300 [Candidatus Paceibacterota bacterium]
MFTSIKRQISNFFTGVTIFRDSTDPCVPKIYLSDAKFAQSLDKIDDWDKLGIGLILNVTLEDPADDEIRQVYSDLGIDYIWLPIRDSYDALPPYYINDIITYVQNWTNLLCDYPTMFNMDEQEFYGISSGPNFNSKLNPNPGISNRNNILIHCSAGINRSGLVAAAILWYTTPNRETLWKKPQDLIDYMRNRQVKDRRIYLLTNRSFVQYLNDNLV